MARLDSGEVGIHYEGREYIFRPSFRALDELHSVRSVFELWYEVQRGDVDAARMVLDVFYTGDDSDDINDLTGYITGVNGFAVEHKGEIPDAELCVLAFALLRNGLQGREGIKSTSKEEKKTYEAPKFDALEYVWSAVDKLGLSMEEAWALTMHEFMTGMMIKYPDQVYDEERENDRIDALMKATGHG